VDTVPPEAPPDSEEPRWRLPSPMRQQGGGLPISETAPRIPRPLRAFNGMPPEEPPGAERQPDSPPRPRDEPHRSIRDLLLDTAEESPPPSLMAGLRSAWRRLRRPGEEEAGD